MSNRRNIRLLLAYDGTRFAGWQRQEKVPTIQGMLENAISVMTGNPTSLHGAGRTDAGVHALGMTANFLTLTNIPCAGFLKGLNSMLPADIRILGAEDVDPNFHARRSARGKTYIYNICTAPIQLPTDRLYSAHVPGDDFNIGVVGACLEHIKGMHDFSSFEATGSRNPNPDSGRGAVREILEAKVVDRDMAGEVEITITGNGFLRHMVRNIVGTLIWVGKGKISVADFAGILAAKDRSCAGPTAPARGLFLKEVHY